MFERTFLIRPDRRAQLHRLERLFPDDWGKIAGVLVPSAELIRKSPGRLSPNTGWKIHGAVPVPTLYAVGADHAESAATPVEYLRFLGEDHWPREVDINTTAEDAAVTGALFKLFGVWCGRRYEGAINFCHHRFSIDSRGGLNLGPHIPTIQPSSAKSFEAAVLTYGNDARNHDQLDKIAALCLELGTEVSS